MATRVLIAGVSTRAAAESAAKAGFAVTAIDAYGDLDQHPAVRSLTLGADARFTAQAAADAVRDVSADVVVYLSPFENHPRAVDALATRSSTTIGADRALWGNAPDVLRRVRDPFLLTGLLRRRGFAAPITRVDVPPELADETEWLVKPFLSGGGQGVRRWSRGEPVTEGHYAQEHIAGLPASIVFAAAAGRAVPLGISRQLVGEAAFGADGFRYCGNVLGAPDEEFRSPVAEAMIALAAEVTREFGLVGVNGIDCVIRDEVPYAIEVNPRWSASMELVERHCGVSVFAIHAAACADETLPAFDRLGLRRSQTAIGKAIVFAKTDVSAGDTRGWLLDESVRDVPKPSEHIAAGQPICTVFAKGQDVRRCHRQLEAQARAIYERLLGP